MKVEVWKYGAGYSVRLNDNIHQELHIDSAEQARQLRDELTRVLGEADPELKAHKKDCRCADCRE